MTTRPGTAPDGDDSFAAKLAELFEHSRDEDGRRYTGKRIAEKANQHGHSLSDAYISQLRTGKARRYCQDLWMSGFQAASWVPEVASGSTSLPFSKVAPSRTSFTRCGALTARHFDCAASISL